jgi:hypothetical protein
MSDVPRPPSAFPPPASDEAWELASAYLDNEVTPAERAQVDSSPALLALVEQLRPAVTALRIPVSVDVNARDTAILAAISAAEPEPDHAAAAPATVRTIDSARSAKSARSAHPARSSNRWLAPVAAAAAVVAIVGVGSAVFNRSSTKSNTATQPATSAKADPAAQAASATTKAAAPATTASPAALQSTNDQTTAAASASATTQAAAASGTEAPATTTTATPALTSAAPKAVPTRAVTVAPPVGGGGPLSQFEADELRRFLGDAYRQTFPPICPAPADAPLAIGTIDWRGRPATVFVNEGRTTVVVVVDDGCVRDGGLTV